MSANTPEAAMRPPRPRVHGKAFVAYLCAVVLACFGMGIVLSSPASADAPSVDYSGVNTSCVNGNVVYHGTLDNVDTVDVTGATMTVGSKSDGPYTITQGGSHNFTVDTGTPTSSGNVSFTYGPGAGEIDLSLGSVNCVMSVDLSVDVTEITLGQSATLSWTSDNAPSLTASGAWSGAKSVPSGNETVTPSLPGTYTYTLEASGNGAPITDSVTFVVDAVVTPPPNKKVVSVNVTTTAGKCPSGTDSYSFSGDLSKVTLHEMLNGKTVTTANPLLVPAGDKVKVVGTVNDSSSDGFAGGAASKVLVNTTNGKDCSTSTPTQPPIVVGNNGGAGTAGPVADTAASAHSGFSLLTELLFGLAFALAMFGCVVTLRRRGSARR